MKIAFDGRYAEGNIAGIGKYIQNLVSILGKKGNECTIFYTRSPQIKITSAKAVVLNSLNRYHFEQVLLPRALKDSKVDLYHAAGNVGIPLFCPVPAVLTVHDLIPLEIEDYFSYSPAPPLSKFSYITRLKSSINSAAKIITVSEYVKKKLVKKLNVDSGKIQTIYSGSPKIVGFGSLPSKLKGQIYILNHGGIDIRKNLDKLVEAFVLVHRKYKEVKLVITGDNKRIRKELSTQISYLGLDGSVIFTGYVDDKVLNTIIKSAKLICYPTLSEGFGFPVLEGYGAGVPVVSSNTSSIPEVAGEAAILINPKNVYEIAMAIESILQNPVLVKEMVSKGKARYNEFSWEKSVNEHINLYNHL
jgi:glycosyltransferase involved in cell wall biosynthesis